MLKNIKLTSVDCLSKWDEFVSQSDQGSIFCKSFWLRAVTRNNFEIITLQSGGSILAGMPIPFSLKKPGRITNPVFTQTLGILFGNSERCSYEGKLSEQIELTQELIRAIPHFDFFQLNFHYRFTNWTPFYWANFDQTTRYTYVIQDISNPDQVLAEFSSAKRNDVKKATKTVVCNLDWSPKDFYCYHKMCLKKENEAIRYGWDSFSLLADACQGANASQVFRAVDKDGNTHAAMFIVYDATSAYLLQTAIDPEFRRTSALSFLIYQAICYFSSRSRAFDFEGSMIPGPEASYRKFGGRQMPIMQISLDRRPALQKAVTWSKRLGMKLLMRFK